MANTSVHEKNTNESTESRFINDDPKLPEIFPEELAGWHKYVQIKKGVLFYWFIGFFFYNSYIEWEKYPDRCNIANEILTAYKDKFTQIPEFQVEH